MRKGILAIAAAGSVFAMTAAFATGITINASPVVQGKTSASVSVLSSVCHDVFDISYTLSVNGTVTDVALDDVTGTPTAGCLGASATITMNGTGAQAGNTYTATANGTGDYAFDLSAGAGDYTLGTLTGVAALITAVDPTP